MKRRRSVITGVGPVTPIGTGRQPFWVALTSGASGIRPITLFDSRPFPIKVAGEIQDFDPGRYMDRRDFRRLPRVSQLAVAAARLALDDSGLDVGCGCRVGACFASSVAGYSQLAMSVNPAFCPENSPATGRSDVNTFSVHAGTSAVCQVLGLSGPKSSMSSGCTSGLDVVAWARDQVTSGRADAVVVGSSDAPLYPATFGLLCGSGIYSRSPGGPRPYDSRHDGAAISEGACAVVVEELEHALHRRAVIYAEVLGRGSAGEAGDFLKLPTGKSSEDSMKAAIADAELAPEDIDGVCAMILGIAPLDITDCAQIRAALGSRAESVPAPSIFGALGHSLSASSSMQVAAMALAIRHQRVPPTINFERAATGCELDCVANRSRPARLRKVLIQSRSLSLTCGALVMGSVPSGIAA